MGKIGSLAMMIVRLQSHFGLRVCDWLLACLTGSVGFALLNLPPDVWNQPSLVGLRQFASQGAWGGTLIVLGSARLIALVINGAMRRTPHVRGLGAFLTCFVWTELSLGLLAFGGWTIAIGIFPWLLIADLYNVYRAAQDARASDNRASSVVLRDARSA